VISTDTVYNVVSEHAGALGFEVAAHNLRLAYAKLARKGGAELTQIQLTLDHANVAMTQRYVDEDLDLQDTPCDKLGLRL
jgi:site-specific recombinase XerD